MERVSWANLQTFLSRLNTQEANNIPTGWAYVLPTEAQWEYACGQVLLQRTRGEIVLVQAMPVEHGMMPTKPRMSASAANPWGFFDMHGNVWEWTADAYGAYASGVQTDPFNTGVGSAVLRGVRGRCGLELAFSLPRQPRPERLVPKTMASVSHCGI